MLFFDRGKLVILSQPKTGTTALGEALSDRASIAFRNPPSLKHISYGDFEAKVVPMIRRTTRQARPAYEVVSVMRDPLDWLGSWYRYRSRKTLAKRNSSRYTGDMSFDEFVAAACQSEEGNSTLRVGSPCATALNRSGIIGVDRLFPYEDLTGFYEYLESRLDETVEVGKANVSPRLELKVSSDVDQMVRDVFKNEFDLHASLKSDGSIDPKFRETIFKRQFAEQSEDLADVDA